MASILTSFTSILVLLSQLELGEACSASSQPCSINIAKPLPVTGVSNLNGICNAVDGQDIQRCQQTHGQSFNLNANGCAGTGRDLLVDGTQPTGNVNLTCTNGKYVASGGGISDSNVMTIMCRSIDYCPKCLLSSWFL